MEIRDFINYDFVESMKVLDFFIMQHIFVILVKIGRKFFII